MKITKKQYQAFQSRSACWISDNDNYNLQHFGITKETYNIIHHAHIEETGICPSQVSLAAINKRLK